MIDERFESIEKEKGPVIGGQGDHFYKEVGTFNDAYCKASGFEISNADDKNIENGTSLVFSIEIYSTRSYPVGASNAESAGRAAKDETSAIKSNPVGALDAESARRAAKDKLPSPGDEKARKLLERKLMGENLSRQEQETLDSALRAMAKWREKVRKETYYSPLLRAEFPARHPRNWR